MLRRRTLKLPDGIEIVDGPRGARFRGSARQLIDLATEIRTMASAPPGSRFRIGRVRAVVWDGELEPLMDDQVRLPAEAWNIAASKFTEVAAGLAESPLDFGSCGFLWPKPEPDIGVELVGDPIEDW